MSTDNVTLADLISSLTLHDHGRQAVAEIAVADCFGLHWPFTPDPDEYCDIGGFLNVQAAHDEHQPLVTIKGPLQRLRGHLPIMLVRCRKLDTKSLFRIAGWRFRSETWRDEWRWTTRAGNDLPDVYVVPNKELYPGSALRLLFEYRNPDGTPDMARWPTPEQFREIMEGAPLWGA